MPIKVQSLKERMGHTKCRIFFSKKRLTTLVLMSFLKKENSPNVRAIKQPYVVGYNICIICNRSEYKGHKIMKTYDTVNTGKLKTEQNITDRRERGREDRWRK